MAYFCFIATALLFGSNFKLMHMSNQVFDWSIVTFGRLAGGAAVLLVGWMWSQHSLRLSAWEWLWIAVAALLGNAIPFMIISVLLELGVDHSFLAMFVPFTPLLTILVSLPLLGIRPTLRQLVGVCGGLVLLLVITGEGGSHGATMAMVLTASLVPLGYACSNTLIRRELSTMPAMPLSALLTGISALAMLPVVVWRCYDNPYATSDPISDVEFAKATAALIFLGPIGTGLAVGTFVWLVQERGPLFAGMVTYVVPPVALLWGWLDGESITPAQLAAIVGILAMVALVQYNPAKRRQRADGRRRNKEIAEHAKLQAVTD